MEMVKPNSDSILYADGHMTMKIETSLDALEAAIDGFTEGVKDLSILFMAVAGSVVMGVLDAVEAIREWKYKRTHNKRRRGWWKPNTNF